ncbi:uncharacterized protein TM35_000571250 [Trypanosoma theileri]|uniref:Mucin-associated surface protein (MASP) n=1 Tax=Trypanosoma theileri TaxID=67003 RepID=A0A1X0NGJ0_9TRYP|nr:uncharacterized protein TM35_000571250 [Trypanosoma theileri]ORC83797.1 hypothetical protein TM35_000571250 [Trypanosoma theileri]
MMMMMCRVMCVLAVVLCCACGYTMAGSAANEKTTNPYGENQGSHWEWDDFLKTQSTNNENMEKNLAEECPENEGDTNHDVEGIKCSEWLKSHRKEQVANLGQSSADRAEDHITRREGDIKQPGGAHSPGAAEMQNPVIEGQGRERVGVTAEGVNARGSPKQEVESEGPVTADEAKGQNAERTLTAERQGEVSNAAPQGDQGTPNNTSDNTAHGDGNPSNQSSAATSVTAAPDTKETNTTTPPSTENTTTEAPTTTPSPVPNTEINTIASTVQKKANVDSSVSPVWMRTAAPLLIVVVLFSATVY